MLVAVAAEGVTERRAVTIRIREARRRAVAVPAPHVAAPAERTHLPRLPPERRVLVSQRQPGKGGDHGQREPDAQSLALIHTRTIHKAPLDEPQLGPARN